MSETEKSNGAPTPKSKSAIREQRRQTVAANLLAGLNYRAIAEGLGVSLGTVANDVKIVMKRWRKEQLEAASEVAQLELVRLDRALFGIWSDVQAGDTASIHTMLKLMERRAKLLGLDAPSNVKVTWRDKLPEGVDPESIKRRMAVLLTEAMKQEQGGEGDDAV